MKKYWVIAIIEALIATIGFLGYIFSKNIYIAAGAATLMLLVGITQPFLRARKEAKLKDYTEKQWQKAEQNLNDHLTSMLKDVSNPPLPIAEIITKLLQAKLEAPELAIQAHMECLDFLEEGQEVPTQNLTTLEQHLSDPALGAAQALTPYLKGLAALQVGQNKNASLLFKQATQLHSSWAAPYLGWMFAEARQENSESIGGINPQINGIELQPFGFGNQDSWLQLEENLRQKQTEQFQEVMKSIGNLYASSELEKSKEQMQSHQKNLRELM